mmetsp:Transcript_17327/g.21308  ORF Transcript_17327/g.21308 Transcript_17327/m.21308 type:complete len:107 (-) Transcript_17327:140-460(-)
MENNPNKKGSPIPARMEQYILFLEQKIDYLTEKQKHIDMHLNQLKLENMCLKSQNKHALHQLSLFAAQKCNSVCGINSNNCCNQNNDTDSGEYIPVGQFPEIKKYE